MTAIPTLPTDPAIGPDDGELSYKDIYESAFTNGEIVLTLDADDEERTRIGLKNYKARLNMALREAGRPLDNSRMRFHTEPSKEISGCIDLTITITSKGSVKVLAMRIPDNDFPE